MNLEERTYYVNLFDIYKSLLTEKQQNYFIEYYLEDFSLKEISENYSVSRNAVFDQVKKVIVILDEYETKLKIFYKNEKIKELISTNLNEKDLLEIIEE